MPFKSPMIYQNWFFLINQYHRSPFEIDGKALNGIQSNRIELKMPFTLLILISLLYHLPSMRKKLLKLVSLGKGQIQKAMLAGKGENQWLSQARVWQHSPPRWEIRYRMTGILAPVYKQQEIGFGIPSFSGIPRHVETPRGLGFAQEGLGTPLLGHTLYLCPLHPHVPWRVLPATSAVPKSSCMNPFNRPAASPHWRHPSHSKREGSSHTGLLLVHLYLI